MPTSWKIAGSYFEACNCEVGCPCVFTSPPTDGECTVLIAWHIDHGRFGEIDLDGLNAVLAAHSPGHMLEVKWKVALYVDERANQGQQDALTQIFSGQAGGHLAGLVPERVDSCAHARGDDGAGGEASRGRALVLFGEGE